MMSHHTHDHGLSNLAYDWITLIQNKAQALRAYDSYIKDAEQAGSQACVELFRRIHDEDMRQLEEAKQHLMMVMQQEQATHS
jgi:rubrerythrin